ncbi:ABC transporter ATP-binding protein [Arachnia propionica]|uniref:ABC transporter ATP-binding protein n=1 Tax=Arachnia propionica TaxID=1750 RepID=A0A3P1TBN8_9ACTN|nr:ABC transporter ATP-binding protein [Arachnia propionica]RRD06708.1 ABC transporter ATP-binding protein [Arachnia propionica]
MSLLRLDGLTVGYGRRLVRAGLDAELAAGELVCLVGPNGAGKSTLLRSLCGLQPVLSGRILLDDLDLGTLSAVQRARRVAAVLTDAVDPGLLSVAEVVALGRHPHTGWAARLSSHDRRVVAESLAGVGAAMLREKRFAELSDGQRQRVMIARALAQEPRLLLLDEPTAFLDPPGRLQVFELLAQLAVERGIGVLVSTHDVEVAARQADRLWVLGEGSGLTIGSPSALARDGTLTRAFGGEYHLDPVTFQFRAPS